MGNMNSPSIRPILGRQFSHFHSHAYTVSLRGKGCDTRIPSSKKAAHHPCELIPPKYRHPERSRGIFIALPPYAHMRPHSNDTLVLPFSPFPHPRFTGLQERSLHFGRDDRWKIGQTRKSLCGTSVSKGLLVSLL